jgi:hypothetical protein
MGNNYCSNIELGSKLAEIQRTYKARVVLSAPNSLEANRIVEKIITVLGKEGIHIFVDEIEELI